MKTMNEQDHKINECANDEGLTVLEKRPKTTKDQQMRELGRIDGLIC